MYELKELFSVIFPTIDGIVKLGLIPRKEEIVEFSDEMYEMYFSVYPHATKPLYTLNTEVKRFKGNAQRVAIFREKQVEHIFRTIEVMSEYAQQKHVDTSKPSALFHFLESFNPMELLHDLDAVVTGYSPLDEWEMSKLYPLA